MAIRKSAGAAAVAEAPPRKSKTAPEPEPQGDDSAGEVDFESFMDAKVSDLPEEASLPEEQYRFKCIASGVSPSMRAWFSLSAMECLSDDSVDCREYQTVMHGYDLKKAGSLGQAGLKRFFAMCGVQGMGEEDDPNEAPSNRDAIASIKGLEFTGTIARSADGNFTNVKGLKIAD